METKTTEKAKTAAPAKAKRKTKKDKLKGGWYMDKHVGKIPLEEYLKDEPKYTAI